MLYTLKTWFLPWLVIADLSRDIGKMDEALHAAEMEAKAANKRSSEHFKQVDIMFARARTAEIELADVKAELAALKAKQPVHGARGRFVSKSA